MAGIRTLLAEYGLSPKKALGQNFLIDQNILDKIIAFAALRPEDTVVEIGPGLGTMTRALLTHTESVSVIEYDQALQPLWQTYRRAYPHLRVLFQDVLTVDLEAWLQEDAAWQPEKGFKVCANIPYQITTPILFQLLETCPHLQSALLMMQKEVAQRLTSVPGSKDYGRLTLTASYYAAVETLTAISRHCFFPQPQVDSALVRLTPHPVKPVTVRSEARFKALLQAVFSKRRKTILNSASDFLRLDKAQMAQILRRCHIDPASRPENLSLQQYADLVNGLEPVGPPV
jgi:16S rRNA (adenine1518-N6/adenine1519-N6)-dimethyltransferase